MKNRQVWEVSALQSEFERLIGQKRFAEALPVIRKLADRMQQMKGDGSDEHNICRDNLAGTLFYLGRYEEAAEQHWQVIRSQDQKSGVDDLSIETNLHYLARCYYELGDFVSAEPIARRLLKIRQKQGPALAEMGNLAACLRAQGKNDAAEKMYQKGITLSEPIAKRQPEAHAHALNNYGLFLKDNGRFTEAVHYYRAAVEILAKLKGRRKLYLTVLANLANVYQELGDDGAVRETYDRLDSLFHQWEGFAPEVRALSLNNQAQRELHLGNHQSAQRMLQESMEIVMSMHGERHPRYATAVNNMGAFYLGIGDVAKAEQQFKRALEIRRLTLGSAAPEVAQSLNNLGELARHQGDLQKALPLLREAIEVKQRAYRGPHPSLAASMNNLGHLYLTAQRWDDAKKLLHEALELIATTVGRRHPDYAQTLQNLGDMHKRRGEHERAEEMLTQSRAALSGKYRTSQNFVITTISLAELYVATERYSEALALMNEVATLDQGIVGRAFAVTSERQRMMFLEDIRLRDHVYLSLILSKFRDSAKAIQDAFAWVLKRKALTAEVLAGQRDGILGGRHPNLRSKLAELTSVRREIAASTLAGPNGAEDTAYTKRLAMLEARRETLESELSNAIPEIELLKRLEAASPAAIAQKLPAGTVLVEFVRLRIRAFEAVVTRGECIWEPDRYIAFVMLSDEPNDIRLVDLGNAGEIDNLVAQFRDLASVPPIRRAASLNDTSLRLRIAVFAPLLGLLNGSRTLLLSPDGDLNTIPFEALPLEDGRLVIDEYRISYLTCGRDPQRFNLPSFGQAGESIIVADPAYNLTALRPEESYSATRSSRDMDRGMRFGPLRHTRSEAESIAELLGVKPWLGPDALEGPLKRARSPLVLHLATHGFVLQDQSAESRRDSIAPMNEHRLAGFTTENPLIRSGLALAGVNIWLRGGSVPAEAEDGLLTAEDVIGMDLLDTELVVLSACETGLGKVHVGEGVFGLRRAFMLAGARRLIMSLWKVPDLQTKELMIEFYKRTLAGDGVADALRGAKLMMKAVYPDSYYWAAFVFLGDPSPFQVRGGAQVAAIL
jgi:CHAT domain-containing protein/Tfp pilus assembly protein PilF